MVGKILRRSEKGCDMLSKAHNSVTISLSASHSRIKTATVESTLAEYVQVVKQQKQ